LHLGGNLGLVHLVVEVDEEVDGGSVDALEAGCSTVRVIRADLVYRRVFV
jgi:hypothetical protein